MKSRCAPLTPGFTFVRLRFRQHTRSAWECASSLDAESLRHCAILPDRNDPALRGVSHLREIGQSKNASGPAIASRFITLLRRSPNRFLGSEYCVAGSPCCLDNQVPRSNCPHVLLIGSLSDLSSIIMVSPETVDSSVLRPH